jgi:uncharacterized protein
VTSNTDAPPSPYLPGDDRLREILDRAETIAVVGLSSDPQRPSYNIGRYLQQHGWGIVPVNPNEEEVLGERSYPSLTDVPANIRIDIVDVFRRAEFTPEIARQAVDVGAGTLWLQQDIVNEEARRIAEADGLDVVMGVCIAVTDRRLAR